MKWITREQIRIDRVSSAWLIKKFVDPKAEFLFVPRAEVMTRAQAEGAIPFHVPDAELGQRDGKTAFDAIIAKYNLTDPALLLLADMVRSADRRLADPPEGAGVAAMSPVLRRGAASGATGFVIDIPLARRRRPAVPAGCRAACRWPSPASHRPA